MATSQIKATPKRMFDKNYSGPSGYYGLYLIEYEIPPLRAIYTDRILASFKNDAIRLLRVTKGLSEFKLRSIKQLELVKVGD